MKTIAVTQRVYENKEYAEKYDQLDQRWIDLLLSLNLWPILVPNNLVFISKFVAKHEVDGVLLTGGNSLVSYGGNAPERDEAENFLLEWALKNNVPLLGVCRGMQVIQDYFGNELKDIAGHVAQRHKLVVESGCRLSRVMYDYSSVNSYHNQGTMDVYGDILKIAQSEDGVVMAIEHINKEVYGVMWHPERETITQAGDQLLFNYIFNGKR